MEVADRRLDVIGERFDRATEIDAQINAWLSTRTVDEAIGHLQERGVPASRLLTMSQVLDEEQLALRRFFVAPEALGRRGSPWPRAGPRTALALARPRASPTTAPW